MSRPGQHLSAAASPDRRAVAASPVRALAGPSDRDAPVGAVDGDSAVGGAAVGRVDEDAAVEADAEVGRVGMVDGRSGEAGGTRAVPADGAAPVRSGGDDSGDVDDPDDWGDDGDDDEFEELPTGHRGLRAVTVIRAVLVLVVVAVVGVVTALAVSGPATPGDTSVAAGLARDMTDHHAQAVDMATIIQGRTHDSQIRYLATDIALTQTNQMGQMQGWLNDWNLSVGRSGEPMAWMSSLTGSGMHMGGSAGPPINPALMKLQPDGLMPGMATQAQVNQLRTLPPAQADKLFLTLMIAHHQGGVAMAQAAIDLTKERVVVNLCRTMVASQQAEIVQMTQMLKARQ